MRYHLWTVRAVAVVDRETGLPVGPLYRTADEAEKAMATLEQIEDARIDAIRREEQEKVKNSEREDRGDTSGSTGDEDREGGMAGSPAQEEGSTDGPADDLDPPEQGLAEDTEGAPTGRKQDG